MILLPGRFIWLAQPRAGSRSVADVLVRQCGGKDLTGAHHAHASHMSILNEYDEPAISLIRNPYDVVLGRYAYATRNIGRFIRNKDFGFWFDWWKPDGWNSFRDHIAQYYQYVKHYYIFEQGLEPFFRAIGFPTVEIPWIGQYEYVGDRLKIDDLDPQHKQLIDERFSFDVELYQSVASREPFIFS